MEKIKKKISDKRKKDLLKLNRLCPYCKEGELFWCPVGIEHDLSVSYFPEGVEFIARCNNCIHCEDTQLKNQYRRFYPKK